MLFGTQIRLFLHCSEKYVTECEAGGEAKISETIDTLAQILNQSHGCTASIRFQICI